MEELIIVLLQFIIEALVYLPWDWILYGLSDGDRGLPEEALWILLSLIAGVIAGGLSLLILPHVVFGSGSLRIFSLVVTPLASALLARRMSAGLLERRQAVTARQHILGAFFFTLAFVVIRFAYAGR